MSKIRVDSIGSWRGKPAINAYIQSVKTLYGIKVDGKSVRHTGHDPNQFDFSPILEDIC